MTSRILPCIVPLLLAAVAHADPGELFPGKGTSQPDSPVAVTPPAATQPAGKTPTTKPEVLTVAELVRRIPDECWEPKADFIATGKTLRALFHGKTLVLPTRGGNIDGTTVRYHITDRFAKAVRHRLVIDVVVQIAPGAKLNRNGPRATVDGAPLRHDADASVLYIGCRVP